jgi:Farnesoic acid 0-methyl transferase
LCNPNEFSKFYCCWHKGHVCVRRGGPDGEKIMEALDCVQFGVLFVGIRTAWGATGQWKLAFGPQMMRLYTPNNHGRQGIAEIGAWKCVV